MTTRVPINDSELREATHKRDGETVSQFEVRFTDPSAWVAELKLDYEDNAIEANIVRLAVINQRTHLDDIDGGSHPGGDRINPYYRNKYVEASYRARGQLIKLSCWCGVALHENAPERVVRYGKPLGVGTALAIQEGVRKVQAAAHRMRGLTLRGGGEYVQDGPWTPPPDCPIEAIVQLYCATCEGAIYWSNKAWRHADSGQAEVTTDIGRDGIRVKRALDHLADPEEVGRML